MKHIWRRWAEKACCDLHIDIMGMFTMMVGPHQPRNLTDNTFAFGGHNMDIPQFARVFCTNHMLTSIPDRWESSPGWGMELGRELCLSDPKDP